MRGFSLIELLIALAIASILAMVAGPLIFGGIDCKKQRIGWIPSAKVSAAIGEVGSAYLDLLRRTEFIQGPIDIGEVDLGLDYWGNPYQFLDHSTVNGNGPKRKYKSNVPVNSRYDFYSMGPDGKTATPMVSEPGGDDIVIANDGSYVGVACFYGD